MTFLGSVSGGVFWSGIFFVTQRHYAFSEAKNLALALGLGAFYAVAALGAGRIYALAGIPTRRLLAGSLLGWGAAALFPVVGPRGEWGLWLGALVGSAVSGLVWPAVESYLGGRRHGAELRRSIGSFNVTWTAGTALPLLVMPLLTRLHALAPLAACLLVNSLACVFLFGLPREPARAEPEVARAAVGREYPFLLRSAGILLPLSYLMSATLSPVLPHRLAALGPGPVPASVAAATWMVTRFFTLGAMARLSFWHGRWSALFAAAVMLAVGLGFVLLASSFGVMVLGLALFGIGMALTYCTTIYYSLSVGHGAVDAGGGFEALVGLGYVLGPLVGLAGHALFPARFANAATVVLTWSFALAGGALALRPYLAARRARLFDQRT